MVAHAQRTILDILASSEVDVRVHNKCDLANVRERTMYVIASVLDLLAIDGNKIERNFGDATSPAVPLDAYLQRFFKFTPCKKDAFIAGLIYLDRAITRCGTVIDSTNIHRLFLTSALMAAKLVEDVTSDCPFNNKMFAIVGGVPLEEMNTLEMEFLENMGYRVHIFPREFHQYSDAVNEKVDLLRAEGEIENNSDESSAHMIYSLIFDSYEPSPNNAENEERESGGNRKSGENEEDREGGENREDRGSRENGGSGESENEERESGEENNKSNDDFKGKSSSKIQTSREFSCHMVGGRDEGKEKEEKEKGKGEKEKDKKKKRRRNKKKKNVLLYQ